ncbi:MAG TPA: DUF222 domain-containing protein [Candidatus Dormibacteraeota bacterium]
MGGGGTALELLTQAADLLLAESEAFAGNADAACEQLVQVRTQLNRCELAFSLLSRPVVADWFSDVRPELSPVLRLRHECKMTSGAAAAAIGVAERLDQLPRSREALEAGKIGFGHLNLLARTAEFVGEGFDEGRLLKKAQKLSVITFARACMHERHRLDPKRFADEEEQLHLTRFLELTSTDDGGLWLKGFLDTEGGAHLRTAVEALAQKLPEDIRTAGQRRADALVEIARLALDEGRVPEAGGVRPHLQITASLATLLGEPGAPAAELEGSGPISLEALRRLVGDCSIRRLLLDEDSLVIDVGRERRLFRGGSRVALDHRDGGCIWRACTRPARLCHADHIEPWWAGGESTTTNGRLLWGLLPNSPN